MDDDIYLMKTFPDFNKPGFDINQYNKRFRESNVIIHATSRCISYPEHWGCLSVKCAFGGSEYYEPGKRFYAVDDSNYLVLNEGSGYSSYIFSDSPVRSFTINFSHEFELHATNGLIGTPGGMLENFGYDRHQKIEFTEKLYGHDTLVSPLILKLCTESLQSYPDQLLMKEAYYKLIEKLLLSKLQVQAEIRRVKAAKPSTRTELYRRLHYAKDYMDSCYTTEITLKKLAGIAHLNTAYFLRQFKNYFLITPHQYIIQRRLLQAKKKLETSHMSVTDVCFP